MAVFVEWTQVRMMNLHFMSKGAIIYTYIVCHKSIGGKRSYETEVCRKIFSIDRPLYLLLQKGFYGNSSCSGSHFTGQT